MFQFASVVLGGGLRVVVNCLVGKVGLLVVLRIGPIVECLITGRLEIEISLVKLLLAAAQCL